MSYVTTGNHSVCGVEVDIAGKCYCTVCSKLIVYGSSGKKALKFHANQSDHTARSISVTSSRKLDSNPSNSDFKQTKSVLDSASEVKARIGLFISEHCLPFTLGPELLKLCKVMNKEKVGLESATLSATSTTYATTHGVAEDIKNSVSSNMMDAQFLSLNLDEATMDSGDKVLNVLAQYYDKNLGKCVIDLIGCREINEAPAEQVIKVLEEVLEERNVKWHQIVSILMDNCAVMRGQKEGVEPRARRKNEFLLDVDGDTVHKINNGAQKLFSCVEKFFSVQSLASEIYNDIENSPKQRSIFKDLQNLLGLKRKILLRPISTRFLQFKAVSERMMELWDPLRLYYAASLQSSEKKVVDQLIADLAAKYKLTSDTNDKLSALVARLSRQKLSDVGKLRKDRIVSALFDNETKSLLLFRLYIGILSKFEGFVKCFQSKKPLAHKLHGEVFDVVKTLFTCFIKPEMIPTSVPSKLLEVDFKNATIQLKDHHLCVGNEAYSTLMRVMKDKSKHPWIKSFFSSLREGYIQAATMFLKLPINHPILSKLSYISPSNQISSYTAPALLALAKKLPNVVPECDLGQLDSELRQYVCDDEVTMINCGDDADDDFRIDSSFWTVVFNLKCRTGPRYPILSRLVKALLSIFSGPIVEGSFNVLNDIIEEDRTRLTNHNYESLLMVKSYLNTRSLCSTSMDIPRSMVKSVSSSYTRYTSYLNKKSASSKPTTALVSKDSNHTKTSVSAANQPLVTTTNVSAYTSTLPSSSTTPPSAMSATASTTQHDDPKSCPVPLNTPSNSKRKQTSLAGFFSKRPKTS